MSKAPTCAGLALPSSMSVTSFHLSAGQIAPVDEERDGTANARVRGQ